MGLHDGWHLPEYYRRVYVSFRNCILLLVIVSIFTIPDECEIAKDTSGCKPKGPGCRVRAARPFWFAAWCNCLLPGHALQQVSRQLIDSYTHLRHVVALAYRHRRIVQCLEIDG